MAAPEGPKSGEWYLGVHCKACGAFTVLTQDPQSAGGHVHLARGEIGVTCSACGETRRYRNEEFRSIQAP
jgi:RNase P subunit RPR2